MARRTPRPEAKFTTTLTPLRKTCEQCGNRLWVAYHCRRKVMTLQGLWQLRVVMCQCPTPTCSRYHVRYHPEEEGRWALPHGEFGLDVIALIGAWRFTEHRSVPEMHQRLLTRGLAISEREVTHLMQRYEELVTDAASRIESGSRHGSRSKDTSSWPSTGCSPMWGTRCSGWCATASPKKSCWLGRCSVVREAGFDRVAAGSQAAAGAIEGADQRHHLGWRRDD